jgi:hypothetical protein
MSHKNGTACSNKPEYLLPQGDHHSYGQELHLQVCDGTALLPSTVAVEMLSYEGIYLKVMLYLLRTIHFRGLAFFFWRF